MPQSNAYSDLRVFGEIKAGKLTLQGGYSFPITDGLANQILVTDGSGNLTFQNASAVALTPPAIINGTGLTWSTVAPNTIQGNVSLAPFTTDNLAEGITNLYYQDEYVDDRVNALLVNGTGITKSYNDFSNTLTLGVTLAPFSTTNLTEGTNLYYTDERVEDRMAAVLYKGGRGTGPDAISWTHVDGLDRIFPTVSLTPFSTDDLAEGATNLYLTENSLYDLMDQIIQDSASVTWTRNNVTNRLTPNAATSMIEVQFDGSSIATHPTIDFISSPTITYAINDDIINGKTTIEVDSIARLDQTLANGNTTKGSLIYYTNVIDAWTPGDSTTAINAAPDNTLITKEWFYDNDPAVIVEGMGIGSSMRKDNLNNSIGDYSAVSGGSGNTASGDYSAIVGGTCNTVTSIGSFIGGGTNNIVSGDGAPLQVTPVSTGPFLGAIDGFYFPNTTTSGLGVGTKIAVQISSNFLTGYLIAALGVNYKVGDTIIIDGADIGGISGIDDISFTVNSIIDGGSTLPGGFNNDIFGIGSTIAGGFNNSMCSHASIIGGGTCNYIDGILGLSDFGLGNTIAGGSNHSVLGYTQTIGGGALNSISALSASTIGGGDSNSITIAPVFGQNGGGATISGGQSNSILNIAATISGGYYNIANGNFSSIGGGSYNTVNGCSATIGGGICNLASGSCSFIGGGCLNTASSYYSTVSGGYDNCSLSSGAFVGAGSLNVASGPAATAVGGNNNASSGDYSAILGGAVNTASGCQTTVAGGYYNLASGIGSAAVGGIANTASADYSIVGGGVCNTVSGNYSSILGGLCNCVTHCFSSAVGCNITSVCDNTFHVNCLNLYDTPINSNTATEFLVRKSDGMVAYRAYGGLFAQTGNSTAVTNTVTETTIVTSGVGQLTVPANGFQVGDAFNAKMAGVLSSANGHTLTINIKSGATVLATTGAISMPNLTTQAWNLDVQFIIRTIGGTGSLHASGWFSYNSGSNHVGLNFNTTTSPFDTTSSHTLDITATWNTASTSDSIYSTDFTLHKIF